MNFCPLGVKLGISPKKSTQIHINELRKRIKNSVVSLTSTMEFNYYFFRINEFYDRLYRRKTFVHWYLGAGMEEAEMRESREDMAAL